MQKLVTLWSIFRFRFWSAITDSFVSSVICKHQWSKTTSLCKKLMSAGGFGNHKVISVWLFKKSPADLRFYLLQWLSTLTFLFLFISSQLTRQLVGKPVFARVVFSKGLSVALLVVGTQLFQSLMQDRKLQSMTHLFGYCDLIIHT